MKHGSFDEVTVDVEIINSPDNLPGGWGDTDKMGIGVAVVYEGLTDRFLVFGPNQEKELQQRLMMADRISGFNIWNFDFPVICKLPSKLWRRLNEDADYSPVYQEKLRPKTNDILRRIWQSLGLNPDEFSNAHKGWNLDAVAKGTLGIGKSGNGADAPRWFAEGKLHKLIEYCIDDVKIEQDLAAFVDKYGFVVNGTTGQVVRMKPWEGA